MKTTLFITFLILFVNALNAQDSPNYQKVAARKNARDTVWVTYEAKTIDRLPGFYESKRPEKSIYGGFAVQKQKATGFFRTEKINDRWWLIDPEGNLFVHMGVATFRRGNSERQQSAFKSKFGTAENWVKQETTRLREYGFNGSGAWSEVDLIQNLDTPIVYSVIVSPMSKYKAEHRKKFGGKYLEAGWQGYRFDLAMVFDPEFDRFVEEEISKITSYKDDPFLLGYFTDNEIPWVNDALDRHLTLLAKDEPGYLAAKKWLNERKGKEVTLDQITDEDRVLFSGFYFETYMKKVTDAIHKYDPNHLYLGCRFNQEHEELNNGEIFRIAGKYMDVISINHYRKWEPDSCILDKWAKWSGKPFIITEWYIKGEDSGLPNITGAGWNVKTQQERGLFYQNFVIGLLKNKSCVGWHWFTYQDNDPGDKTTDFSNKDSNKGIVNNDYNRYLPLLDSMKSLNNRVYNLIQYFDASK